MTTIPTTSQLYADILADLEAQYGESIPAFGRVFLRALAGVQAAKMKLYYLAIANLQKNIFVDTADPEAGGGTLERFGRIKLGRNPFLATAGQYEVLVTGTIGSIIPPSTTFKSNDDSSNPGKLFILDEQFELESSPDTITLRALEAGLDSQLSEYDELTATAPIAGVDKIVTVSAETVEPLDAEDIEDYRQNAIEAYRLEPQGGAGSDYRLWANEVQGVRQSYPYAKSGADNEINLFIEATEEDSTDGKGTPTSEILDEVAEVIEFDPDTTKALSERSRRPLGVTQVHTIAVTPLEVNVTINDFDGLTSAIETLIEQTIAEELNRIRPFVSTVDLQEDKNDILDVNRIIGLILTVRPGSVFGDITMEVDGSTLTTYTFTDGNVPHLNSVSYT